MISIEKYNFNPIRLNKKKKLDWLDLWISKSDYIANYYENIKGKYEIIDESIDYYMTLLEMGIYYLRDYSNYYDYVYIQHSMLISDELKEDIKERDFAEYLKYLFYNNYSIEYIYNILDSCSEKYNYYLVFARLLFPSYYFYYFDNIILNNKGSDELKNIINRSCEYELFLKNASFKMNKYLIKKIVLPF